jgi:CBS-domain-containing membrane protein
MKVAEIMSRQVITIRADALVAEAAKLMLEHRVSGLPVLDADGELVGIVTEGDLLCRAETGTDRHHHWLEFLIAPGRFTGDYIRAHARQVHEVMSDPVVTVAPDEPVEKAARLMERHRVKRLPVVEAGLVVGIVARADLVRALACKLAGLREVAATDTAICDSIRAEIANQPWGPRPGVEVTVSDGTVDLYGCILDEHEQRALRVLVENIPGVKAVRNHLVWIEPVSGRFVSADDPESRADQRRPL